MILYKLSSVIDQNKVAFPSPGLPIKLATLDEILSFEN